MQEPIVDFLSQNRIGVFAIETESGAPHAATIHIAYTEDPLSFVFLTGSATRKGQAVSSGTRRASLVIGTNEEEMRTFQLDGTARITTDAELISQYFARFPEKQEKYNPEKDIFVEFVPSWWRYADMKAKLIIASE